MKKLTQLTLVLLTMVVAFAGCEAAKDAASNAASEGMDKMAEMANIEGLDQDMVKGMQEKFTGITDGFKDVTAENVDGLTSKISELGGSIDEMGVDKLPAPAKTFVSGLMTKFADTLQGLVDGVADEGIVGKLKPVVTPLLEKLKSFG